MRDVMEAADHLMRADEGTLRLVVHHDPDMVRDVAAALIARQSAESSLSSLKGAVGRVVEAGKLVARIARHYRSDNAAHSIELPRSYAAGRDDFTPMLGVGELRALSSALSELESQCSARAESKRREDAPSSAPGSDGGGL